jgi:hypothetical protein
MKLTGGRPRPQDDGPMRGSVDKDKMHGRLGVDAGVGRTKIQTRRKPMPVAEHRPKRLISFASLNRTFCIENERKILEFFGQNWRASRLNWRFCTKLAQILI